jgi:hypothetical protein
MFRRAFLSLLLFSIHPVFAADVPRLVVLIIVDQMRADYVPRFDADLSTGGFHRLTREGVYFSSAVYDYGATKTGPGHALIGSGTYPSENGIVGNEWFDRASNRTVACAELAPSSDGRTALRWFKGRSFAQRFHAVYPTGRIYGVSYKARSALLLGGPGQDDAFWWDSDHRRFRAFGADPAWLTDGQRTFPHPAKGDENVDAAITAVATALVTSENLGANPTGAPDVLAIGLSELDAVGHVHGPDAPETRMAVVRADQRISALLSFLSTRIPRERMLVVISADHGVTPVPEVSKYKGFAAGRVSVPWSWRLGMGLVKSAVMPFVYIDEAVAQARGLTRDQAARELREDVMHWEGVQAAYTEAEILDGHAPMTLRRSIDPGRSGDLYIVLKPRYIFSEYASGTTHGQPTLDDQEVPLFFWGAGLKPRADRSAVSPARIAPTVLKALHIPAADLQPPLGTAAKS